MQMTLKEALVKVDKLRLLYDEQYKALNRKRPSSMSEADYRLKHPVAPPSGKYNTIDDEVALKEYLAGKKAWRIASEHGWCTMTVIRHLQKLGVYEFSSVDAQLRYEIESVGYHDWLTELNRIKAVDTPAYRARLYDDKRFDGHYYISYNIKLHCVDPKELADCLDVSLHSLDSWRYGYRTPSIHNLLMLAMFLDIDLVDWVKHSHCVAERLMCGWNADV